ncbi:MAG: rhodanese-like domain-containing protein [Firmicutes bacterium]|nr:rhodanese-like domain-containing protein [Bacillota bacterium]
MRKSVLLIIIAALLCMVSTYIDNRTLYMSISIEEAMEIMEDQGDYALVDVRTELEYNEKHIPGAMNIPNESILSDNIKELPDKDQLILVYCRSGNRSKQAAQKLGEFGYTNVYEMGGILDWYGDTVSTNNEEK